MRDSDDSVPVYRRGPTRSVHFEENLEFFETTREAAMRVPCPDCRVAAGERCRNTVSGELLERFPAHGHRIQQARSKEMA